MKKRTKKTYLSTFIAILVVCEIYSLRPVRPKAGEETPIATRHTATGIFHVHSTYSDGGGSVEAIVKAAQESKLDFIVLTDHMNSQARRDGLEKRYDNLDFFVEMEASTQAGHLLTFFSHTSARTMKDPEVNELAWRHFLGLETRPGLFVALAHPSNIKNPWGRFDRLSEGIEVVNFDSSWQRQLSDSALGFLQTVFLYPFNPYFSAVRFFQLHERDLTSWDGMNTVSPGHFGIIAQDTHSKLKFNNDLWFNWPGYHQTFELASNVVFLKSTPDSDFEKRKLQIYSALKEGRVAMVFNALYPFSTNDWAYRCGAENYRSGESVEFKKECQFVVETPKGFPYPVEFKVLRNGELIKTVHPVSEQTFVNVDAPGAYRLEVWAKTRSLTRILLHRDTPYILYNPIYVR